MTKALIDDCFRPTQDRLRHDEALALLRARVQPVVDSEPVVLADACHRKLAETVHATFPVPAHTNAAVDGYAFAAASYDPKSGSTFSLAGRAAAGHRLDVTVGAGSACRILTGAVMPEGVDTVVMQEDVSLLPEGRVVVPSGLKPRANVRKAGEDVAAGSILLAEGHVLRPQDLAALASVGRDRVACFRRLRVGIVSTGDEIKPAGSGDLAPGEVFDANAPMLGALVALSGAEPHDLGIWPDRPEVVRERLAAAAATHDLILTSGGASRGEEDHMAAAIGELGSRHFWQLAIKPGRPMMLGQIGTSAVVGLPGNPVAVFVCFLMYVHPLLARLGGAPWPEPRRWRVPAAFSFTGRKTGRREFWRGSLVTGADGALAVEKFARDGSGLISGLRVADGLIDIPEDTGDVGAGDTVAFIPFTEFGIAGRNGA
ncbi:MAG: gephyrin-like molybdotransferase Glp [Hyphomicrobiaceae bacterium]